MDIALKINGLYAGYNGIDVLSDITCDIPAGAITGILGPNGAGKSTLLKAILGAIPSRGRSTLTSGGGIRQFAYMPQRTSIDLTFPITAEEVVLQGTYGTLSWWQRAPRKSRAMHYLDLVGLTEKAKTPIGELSGGQLARVLLARALAGEPEVFLLDEPFAAIDARSIELIMGVLRECRDSGQAVVIVHHNLEQAKEFFDHLLIVNHRLVAAGPVADVYTPEVFTEAFGGAW